MTSNHRTLSSRIKLLSLALVGLFLLTHCGPPPPSDQAADTASADAPAADTKNGDRAADSAGATLPEDAPAPGNGSAASTDDAEDSKKDATVAAGSSAALPATPKAKPSSQASGDEPEPDSFAGKIKDREEVEGLFTFYRDADDASVLMAILPEQLDKVYIAAYSRARGDGQFFDSGAMLDSFPFVLHRVGEQIQFRHRSVKVRAPADAAISRAIEKGLSDSIISSAKVVGKPHPSSGAILVDVADLFLFDYGMAGETLKEAKTGFSWDKSNSYLGSIRSYPRNSEIDTVLHFRSGKFEQAYVLPDPNSFLLTYRWSLVERPTEGYTPRRADDRVGYFTTNHQDYTSVLKEDAFVRYINRWRLEKSEPRFDLSQPRQPIVFWLENTIPVEYREAVREGVLAWNYAFEKIGFEGAIEVKQQPDDADWDAADIRYNTIQWFVKPGAGYAVGPSLADPFTGEIFAADIRLSVDMLRYAFLRYDQVVTPTSHDAARHLHEARFGHAHHLCTHADESVAHSAFALIGAEVMGAPVDLKEYVRQYLIDLVMHEVGHTLGLRHNFKASRLHSIAELRSDEMDDDFIFLSSVMDYSPAKLVTPGTDNKYFYQLRPGPYDDWAIEYGYATVPEDSEWSEKGFLEKIASRCVEPELAYGTDEDAMNSASGIDPYATRWDLGDDPISYAETQVEIAQNLWSELENEFEKEGERYQKLRHVFGYGFMPHGSALINVCKLIGGIEHHRAHIDDGLDQPPLNPVPADKQRRAMEYLSRHVFSPKAFDVDPELLRKLAPERMSGFAWITRTQGRLDYPMHEQVHRIQSRALGMVLDPLRLERLRDFELYQADRDDRFGMADVFSELQASIWAELESGERVNSYRRALQREHLDHLIRMRIDPAQELPEDARTLARYHLELLSDQLEDMRGDLDTMTRAHLNESHARIKAALDADLAMKQ